LVTYADAPVAYESRLLGPSSGRWHPPGLVEALERWTLRQSRAVVTISHPAARQLARYGVGVPIVVVSNGFEPRWFPVLDAGERGARRRALGLTAPCVVGFAGTFRPFHGIALLGQLIEATAARADTQWLLIGDGPERAGLQAALGHRPGVLFLGRRPPEEVGALLALVDVAVAPYPAFEGDFYFCPLKVIEYAAAGCAVVASALGDVPLLLDHGRAGVVLNEPSLEAWRAAVEGLLNDPERSAALGQAARQWVHAHYTWRHAAEQIERVLYQAVTDHGLPRTATDHGRRTTDHGQVSS
jgi:glycosyltransferase involved in cell wall biosynthesis